ncbi:MAG: hypothetical protein ABIY55_12560 [Kofleriaceae bacterium]
MNKDNKNGTANTPKRLTIQDLKKILGGLGSNVMAFTIENPPKPPHIATW